MKQNSDIQVSLHRVGLPNLVVIAEESKNVSAESKNHNTDVPMIDIDRIILEEEKRINEKFLLEISKTRQKLFSGLEMSVRSSCRKCQTRKEMTLRNSPFSSCWPWTPRCVFSLFLLE